jgi:hypothetical protein
MFVVYALLAAFAAILLIALVVPWHVDVSIEKAAEAPRVTVRTRLRWLMFDWRLRTPRPTKPSPPRPRARRRFGFRSVRAAWSTPGFKERIGQFLLSSGRLAVPRSMTAHWRVGFEDPADTGTIVGTSLGLAEIWRGPAWQVAVEPDFSGPVLEGDAHVLWSVRPIAVLWPMLTLAGSPVVWRAGRAALRSRRL